MLRIIKFVIYCNNYMKDKMEREIKQIRKRNILKLEINIL